MTSDEHTMNENRLDFFPDIYRFMR